MSLEDRTIRALRSVLRGWSRPSSQKGVKEQLEDLGVRVMDVVISKITNRKIRTRPDPARAVPDHIPERSPQPEVEPEPPRKEAPKKPTPAKKPAAKPIELKPKPRVEKPRQPRVEKKQATRERDRLVLLARDPEWAYAYWSLKSIPENTRLALRIYDVDTKQDVLGTDVDADQSRYWMNVPMSDRRYIAKLLAIDGTEESELLRSNVVHVPPQCPSRFREPRFVNTMVQAAVLSQRDAVQVPPRLVPDPFDEGTNANLSAAQVVELMQRFGSDFNQVTSRVAEVPGSVQHQLPSSHLFHA